MKPLHEMNAQEANAQFAQDFLALIQKYEAAGFRVETKAEIGPPYLVMALRGLKFPIEQAECSTTFVVVKNQSEKAEEA